MKVLEGLKNRYREELVRKAEEKLTILFNRYKMDKCYDLCFDCSFKLKSSSPIFSKVHKLNYPFGIVFYVTIECDNEHYVDYTELKNLDTSILEYIAFNAIVGCYDCTNYDHLLFTDDMIV